LVYEGIKDIGTSSISTSEAAQPALAADLAFGQSFSWYALWPWNQYNEPNPAKPARQLKRKPLGRKIVFHKGGIMKNKSREVILIILIFLFTFIMACNFPIMTTSVIDDKQFEENKATIQPTHPIVVMLAGSGYIFSTQQISKEDRDIWWNAVQFVPSRDSSMVSLGKVNSLENINTISFTGEKALVLVPTIGEGFGVEISRNNELNYAIIRVIEIDSEFTITFEYIYPFLGKVQKP
jgi:hypothetical protein